MLTFKDFRKTFAEFGLQVDLKTYQTLLLKYCEPTRSYHTAAHIDACLNCFDQYEQLAIKPYEIRLALWYHDIIYDTRCSDNEEKSAEFIELCLQQLGADTALIRRVAALIIATKTHLPTDSDCALLIDVDLAILGAPVLLFETYDRGIRKEYSWIPEKHYNLARVSVLETFLSRSWIYHTLAFRSFYESQARVNLDRKIAELKTW